MLVQDVMTHETMTVQLETTVKHATELLAKHQISTLPVLDAQGRLAGIVSEADLIRDAFPRDPRSQLTPIEDDDEPPMKLVSDVMTARVIAAYEGTDVAEAVELMTSTGIKCLPVVDDVGNLIGVLSRSDLVRVRARADEVIEAEVDAALVSLGHSDWLVSVNDGVVDIEGPETDRERSVARAGANTVPGVVSVKVR
jgi:CBS-domain-containing membrane protein